VPAATEAAMLDHYLAATGLPREAFLADYALLGAQRNAKIVGIFIRLWQRDGKPRYLADPARLGAAGADLKHPALAPVAAWFDANIPAELRETGGGSFGMKPLASDTAMVLAAGIGKRMRPLTATRPKPMVKVLGKPLIDHALDKLATAGSTGWWSTHYLGDHLAAHLSHRKNPAIAISDERDALLETGGGMVRADRNGLLPDTFFALNSDNIWLDGPRDVFTELSDAWDDARMDALVLVVRHPGAHNYQGVGDFISTRWAGSAAAAWPRGALYLHRHPARLAPSAA
jgi:hypothetical protein